MSALFFFFDAIPIAPFICLPPSHTLLRVCFVAATTEAQEEVGHPIRLYSTSLQVLQGRGEGHRFADGGQLLQVGPGGRSDEEVVQTALVPTGEGGDREATAAEEGAQMSIRMRYKHERQAQSQQQYMKLQLAESCSRTPARSAASRSGFFHVRFVEQ